MRPVAAGIFKALLFIFSSLCAWYSGYLLAELIPDVPLSNTLYNIRSIGERPVLKAPAPKRQKCDHWSPCPPDTYAYRLLSGGGRDKYAKICFEDEMLLGEKTGNVARGINIAVINYETGKVIVTKYFDMYEGDNSEPMTKFIQSTPSNSLLFMVTHDDGSHQLQAQAKDAIEALGSKEIKNMKFRSSWVFVAAKGFELPSEIEREKVPNMHWTEQLWLIAILGGVTCDLMPPFAKEKIKGGKSTTQINPRTDIRAGQQRSRSKDAYPKG